MNEKEVSPFLPRYIVERNLREATEWLPAMKGIPTMEEACKRQIAACTRLLQLMDGKVVRQ